MALLMKLSNVVTNKGKFVYSRRIPTDIKHLYPSSKQPFFRCRLRVQKEGADLVAEHAALEAAFTRLVSDARDGVPEALGDSGIARYKQKAWSGIDDPRTEREKWEEMRDEAEALVRSIRGVDDVDHLGDGGDQARREVAAAEIERANGDPLLYRAVTQPDAAPPPVTLADAARVYEKERLGENPSKSARNTFNKIKRRLEASLGPLNSIPLSSLSREHARKVRDDLLTAPKNSGNGTLSPASVAREINSIKAMITVGITEFDLRGQAFNPFEKLSLPASVVKSVQSEWEERDPLPDELLCAVRRRVMMRVRVPELRLIWRLLQATGCRGAEITGLLIEDVVIDHATPHLWVRWNDERQLKTKTSVRPIPLVGDGLEAAKEALEAVRESRQNIPALFPRYAREGGPDAVSGALMGHLRKETKNPRHVVYSLRHNVKSWLGQSGASERDENRLLGHAEASVGNRYYGGLDDRLRGTTAALEAALALAPEGAWEVI
ncbi:tyrosine-type recombinase/integrase [Aliiroseovarius sp. M344]|uniref:tyrosine-type recombinase/integrase n=1 Tax=Aliiroseovarius sp. M344 TaxID=2867010 RepID=UPI0021AD96BC|nr:tyrosine-type recombinase/integrase [Aliiroseovarius sp. M344]UWQ15669.1 tyrosine-type recombinase/integrase [Aliiroseovarius sp. M344]